MNKEIHCFTNEGMEKWWFFEIYTVYMKHLGQFFFHTYSLTFLNKDTSALLKVINIWRS